MRRGFLIGVAVLVLGGAGVRAATDPAAKCSSTKRKASGKKAAGKLKCHAKALTKGVGVDPFCLGKEEAKFSAAFEKAEGKGGCFTLGDAAAVECKVDEVVDVAAGELAPATVSFA